MSYIGNNLQVAYPSYRNIDDISGSFDGVTTSFPLTVGGSAPVPAPLSSNQCLISVGGVVQRPDDSGTEGFLLSGGNIVFSAAPTGGEDFFGVILAGADYVNVGGNFPSGTVSTPSITFDTDLDTGIYNPAANQLGITCAGSLVSTFTSAGQSILSGSASAPSLFVTGDTNTGIYSPGADSIAISTGGAQRATVDSSGRLLVGTSTARDNFFNSTDTALVQVEGANNNAKRYSGHIYGAASGAGPWHIFAKHRSSSLGGTTVVASGDQIGAISFQGADGTEFVEGARIEASVDGTPGSNDMPGRLVFSTTADGASSPTERMRITNNGSVLVADTALRDLTGQSFQVSGFSTFYQTSGGTTTSAFTHTGSGTQTVCLFRQGNPAATVGSITVSAGTSTAFNTSSDYRLKENIAAVTDGITRLQQLKPSRFNFIADPDTVVDGFIAHEVQTVVPEAITGEKDAVDDDGHPVYQGIDQSKLVPLLTAALQEAIGEMESLKARVAALESA